MCGRHFEVKTSDPEIPCPVSSEAGIFLNLKRCFRNPPEQDLLRSEHIFLSARYMFIFPNNVAVGRKDIKNLHCLKSSSHT